MMRESDPSKESCVYAMASPEDMPEVVVQLSEEISQIEPDNVDPVDSALHELLRQFDANAVRANEQVLREIDVLLADDSFYGSIHDSVAGITVSRMTRGMQEAIVRGADKAVAELTDEPELDATARLIDELDVVMSTNEPLREALLDVGDDGDAYPRKAAEKLVKYVKQIRENKFAPVHNNVIAIEIGQLIKDARIAPRKAYDGIAFAVKTRDEYFGGMESGGKSAIAAGFAYGNKLGDLTEFLLQLKEVLQIEAPGDAS